jgi:hypothetical protein
MFLTIADRADHHPVTAPPAAELERIVHAATQRPCAARGANPEDWFPAEPGSGYRPKARARYEARAVALCRGCPVAVECLELAMLREGPARGHGIAGGTAPWQRQAVKASRGLVVRRG